MHTTVELRTDAKTLRVGPNWLVQVPFAVKIQDPEIEGVSAVELSIRLVDGTLQATKVAVIANDGSPITGTVLRGIPVKELTRHGVSAALSKVLDEDQDAGYFTLGRPDLSDEEIEKIRLRGPVESSLEVAASIYELARITGLPPAREVEKVLGMPRTTVSKWIRKARESGLLGDADGPAT